MFFKEDNTFYNIKERSVEDWLEQMAEHEDLAVRGGVKATREYIASLKKRIQIQEEKSALKDQYLKKLKNKSLPEKRNV